MGVRWNKSGLYLEVKHEGILCISFPFLSASDSGDLYLQNPQTVNSTSSELHELIYSVYTVSAFTFHLPWNSASLNISAVFP